MIGAAVDVGSNSVHLLVGVADEAGVSQLHEESVLLGLGDDVDRPRGVLADEARASTVAALLRYRDVALARGAQVVTFVGTEPLRRAANATELVEEVMIATGVPLHVISAETEAVLTYLGVSGGRRPADQLLVVDIGGGSTEVVLARAGEPISIHSLPTGSSRLAEGVIYNDPPTPSELDRLRLGALSLVGALPTARPARAVMVGGTATNLVRLVPLSRAGLEQAHGLLTALPAAELVDRYAVNSRRARQLPAGAAIVAALLDHFGIDEAEASQASLRDGAILAAQRLGERWPQRLGELLST